MQNPNEDTEWNDVLRKKGIIPQKEKEIEITEEQIQEMVDEAVRKQMGGKTLDEMDLDELDEFEDEEDERVFAEIRAKRIAEMKAAAALAKFGSVLEISGQEYIQEVNKAGDGIWVILHLYKQGIPLCALLNQHIATLARKFPATKFIKSISNTCIPNYPDKNLPTFFIYKDGDMKSQLVGGVTFGGMNCTVDELEWMLHKQGAISSKLERDPREKRFIPDAMTSAIRQANYCNDSDSD